MNFFQRQDEARRASRRLIVLFVIAVIAVVCAVDAVVFFLLSAMQRTQEVPVSLAQWMAANPGTVIGTSLIVVAVIGLASFYKTAVLSGGGGVVARSLGGVRVSADTTDPAERRLLNVVEEMAIASGVPMPEVYLLEQESGINAFAAGHNPANAAIGVTRGALIQLNRSELQGVIAHEFSHILNGDMRLNVRMMGLLFGLLVIALVARTVLRFAPRNGGGSSRKDGGAFGAIIFGAVLVLVIGYVGLFFGRLIQAAISRRRETLADASAVQFTRDPSGIRNALVKIGAAGAGSTISNPEVDEVAHMLFASGMKRLFATHPPLEARLRAIDPHFDPAEFARVRAQLQLNAETVRTHSASTAAPPSARERLDDLIGLPIVSVDTVAALVGNPSMAHMRHARTIRESLPTELVVATRHADSAKAVLLTLALDADPSGRERQRHLIAQQFGGGIVAQMDSYESLVDALEPEQRLPALMLTFPSLHQITRDERLQLMSCLNGMLQREGALSLHSYVLRRLAQVQLRDAIEPGLQARSLSLSAVTREVQVVLSVLAGYGHARGDEARRAYEAGMHRLYPRERPGFEVQADWNALDAALARLDSLVPIAKEQLVEAMLSTATHDAQLTVGEAELLRAICASLHCPLPPLIAE